MQVGIEITVIFSVRNFTTIHEENNEVFVVNAAICEILFLAVSVQDGLDNTIC